LVAAESRFFLGWRRFSLSRVLSGVVARSKAQFS
jgi:hypothetical protein